MEFVEVRIGAKRKGEGGGEIGEEGVQGGR